jgi:EmrB/QacA subfamily drug resistance transporter
MATGTKPTIIAMLVGSAIIMQQIDATAITTALPQMAVSLDTDPVRLSVAITAYLLSLAVFIPVSGWAADRYGGRTVFRLAIALFTLGSILCGISDSLLTLTASRVLQGFGGSMMVPVGRLVLFRSVDKSQLVRTMAYLQVPGQIGPVLGPIIGGFITTYVSWRWIFLVNVPLGIIGIILVTMLFPNPKVEEQRPLDWLGFLLTGISLSCIMYGIEAAGRGGQELEIGLVAGAFGLGLGIWALRHLRLYPKPILDISIFRIPTFQISISAGSFFRAGAGSLTFLLPILFQVIFGMSAFTSGLLTFATAAGSMSMKATARPILKRFGFRGVLIGNGLISAASIAMCAFFTDAIPAVLTFLLLLIAGYFQSLQFTATQALSYAEVANTQMSTATSIASMAQQLSRGFGIAFTAGLLHLGLFWHGETTLSLGDLQLAFAGASLLVVISIFFALPMEPNAASEVSGHKPKTATSAAAGD